MKKILLVFALSLFLSPILATKAEAAVSFGNWMGGTVVGASNGVNFTAAITATSTTPTVVCSVRYNSATVSVTALVWDGGTDGVNSFSLTQLGSYQFLDTSNARHSFWYLLNADNSNTRIKLTNSGAADTYISCSHFSGGATSNAWTTASGFANATNPTQADTSDTDGSLHVGAASSANGGITPGSNTIDGSEQSDNTDVVYASSNSNNTISQTLAWSGGGSTGGTTAMLRPFVATASVSQDLIGFEDE